ncbi:hypothetical protein XPA_003169 [Xanthoria parietina]
MVSISRSCVLETSVSDSCRRKVADVTNRKCGGRSSVGRSQGVCSSRLSACFASRPLVALIWLIQSPMNPCPLHTSLAPACEKIVLLSSLFLSLQLSQVGKETPATREGLKTSILLLHHLA